MIPSLKKIWRYLEYRAAAAEFLPPPPAVKAALEQEGWTFQNHTVTPGAIPCTGPVTVQVAISPEGRLYTEDAETFEHYKRLRRRIAHSLYLG